MSYLKVNTSQINKKNQKVYKQHAKQYDADESENNVEVRDINIVFRIILFLINFILDPTSQCYFVFCLIIRLFIKNHNIRIISDNQGYTKKYIYTEDLKLNHNSRNYEFRENLNYFKKLECKRQRKKISHEIELFKITSALEEEVPFNRKSYIEDRQFNFDDLLEFFSNKSIY